MSDLRPYEQEFELRFLKSRGNAFQDLFSEVMEESYPYDFKRVRSHGPLGDLKCDGYLPSEKTVFQVYGPEDIRPLQKLLDKIQADFNGALQYWGDRMDRWVFVHNCQAGLPAQALQLLEDLGNRPSGPKVTQWGYPELLHLVRKQTVRSLGKAYETGGTTERPLRKPSEIRSFWLPYWIWLKNTPASLTSWTYRLADQALDFPIKLVSPKEVHKIVAEEELEISKRKAETVEQAYFEVGSVHSAANGASLNLEEVLQIHRRVLIVGDSGSGKSTLLRRFLTNEGKRLYKKGISTGGRQTPVLIELWRFSEHRSLIDLIVGAIVASGLQVSFEQIASVMSEGYVSLLLDGLDEVAPEHGRECLAQIVSLVEMYPLSSMVITSRPFPSPPEGFHETAICPLMDPDIAAALVLQFGSIRSFKKRFGHYSPKDYVRLRLKLEVRQLCRRPLTLLLILAVLKEDGELPSTLYDVYDRFLAYLLDWEVRRGRLVSVGLAASLLEEMAYLMAGRARRELPVADVVRDLDHTIEGLGNNAEKTLGAIASTGLLKVWRGEVSFTHQTFLEFLAARRILRRPSSPEADPLATHLGIARFLCGRLPDVCPLFENILEHSQDVEMLTFLLEEASNSGSKGGRFESLFRSIGFAQELSIELTYSGDDCEDSIEESIRELVSTSIDFKPKALSILKNAADGIVRSRPWTLSSQWFSQIMDALRIYGWGGCELHDRLANILFDDQVYIFEDDEGGSRSDELFAYLDAIYNDDFSRASTKLEKLEQLYRHMKALPSVEWSVNRDLKYLICPEQRELPKHMTDPIAFLRKNPYGWLYGDDDAGEYEFIWVMSEQALFDDAVEFVRSLRRYEMEESDILTHDIENSINLARRSFKEVGLSGDTLGLLFSNMSERTGICWWGTFDHLKSSDDVWPTHVRTAFRNHSDQQPIQGGEEFRFADYVTRHPFSWEVSSVNFTITTQYPDGTLNGQDESKSD
jgi:hypothetical protein